MESQEEIIPDSKPTTFGERSPSILENLTFLPPTSVLLENNPWNDGDSIADSQETHLSEGNNGNASMEIPVICTTKEKCTANVLPVVNQTSAPTKKSIDEHSIDAVVSRCPPNDNRTGEFIKDAAVLQKAHSGLEVDLETQTTVVVDEEQGREEATQAESDVTQLDSSTRLLEEVQKDESPEAKLPDWSGRYEEVTKDLEIIDTKISKLIEKLSSKTSISDLKLSKKESKYRKKVAKIAGINKKEKEELMTLKRSGAKVCKDQLMALAKCHRKLVSVVQSQKNLSEKIERIKKEGLVAIQGSQLEQDVDSTPAMECSQSLLPNLTSHEQRRVFSQSTCLPPSILKCSRQAVENAAETMAGTSTQKKIVKFHISYKEMSSGNGSANKEDVVDLTTHNEKNTDVDMADLFGEQSDGDGADDPAPSSETVTMDDATNPRDDDDQGGCIVPHSHLTTADGQLPPSTPQHFDSPMEFCANESIESMSLISGISGTGADIFPRHPQQNGQQLTIPGVLRLRATLPLQNLIRLSTQIIQPQQVRIFPGSQSQSSYGIGPPPQKVALFSAPSNAETLLNLSDMIRRGMLAPGHGVLRYVTQGKTFAASLLSDGSLQGAGGEVFPSPMTWLKALSGTKFGPPRIKAYQSVSYNGRTLCEICQAASREHPPRKARATQVPLDVIRAPLRQPCYTTETQNSQCQGNTTSPGVLLQPPRVLLTPTRLPRPTIQQKRVLLVQDDELFKLDKVLPGFLWDDWNDNTPKNIEEFFI